MHSMSASYGVHAALTEFRWRLSRPVLRARCAREDDIALVPTGSPSGDFLLLIHGHFDLVLGSKSLMVLAGYITRDLFGVGPTNALFASDVGIRCPAGLN
jgi:hypothetical protein